MLILSFFFCQGSKDDAQKKNEPDFQVQYNRIISLSPNITEILFALGLGDKVVGVTRFCKYPPEAKEKMQVGGYLDPNYEAILSLKPDVVVLLPENEQVKNSLSELNIKYLVVNNKNVSDILKSIDFLGKEFSVNKKAENITSNIRVKMNRIQAKTNDSNRPKVMIVVERTMGTGVIEDIYIAGKNTFYDELIISAEGIIHLNPDFIIELVPQLEHTKISISLLLKDWQSLPQLNAIKNHHIYLISQDYAVIPGPRFILFLEDLVRMIHPEIDWYN